MSVPTPPRPLPTTRQQVIDELKEARRKNPRPQSPCITQTPGEIEAYYRNSEVGARAVVRQMHSGVLEYRLTAIESRNPASGRVYLLNEGGFYMKSGKNCHHPTGQKRLVTPTEAVLAWAAEYPRGAFGFVTYPKPDAQTGMIRWQLKESSGGQDG